MNKRIAAGLASFAAIGFMAVNLSGVADAAPGADGPGGIHKSYVCKYVSKPGEPERLQTGQNPIWVDNNSLLGKDTSDVYVGQEFSDAQGRSVVIVANTAKLSPEPGVDACGMTPSPTTTDPSSPPPTPES